MPTLRGIWPNLEDKILIRFGNQPINKVSCNSQNISPGDLFVAIKGASCDGHQFIDEAIRRGARIIVSEEDKDSFLRTDKVLFIKVPNSRLALAELGAYFADAGCVRHLDSGQAVAQGA